VVRMARFEKVVRMARFEKFFPRGQEYSSAYSVRDKFTAVDISTRVLSTTAVDLLVQLVRSTSGC
jgi:hypothetical protein